MATANFEEINAAGSGELVLEAHPDGLTCQTDPDHYCRACVTPVLDSVRKII